MTAQIISFLDALPAIPLPANSCDIQQLAITARHYEALCQQFWSANQTLQTQVEQAERELQDLYRREAELEYRLSFYINPATIFVPINRISAAFWRTYHKWRRTLRHAHQINNHRSL